VKSISEGLMPRALAIFRWVTHRTLVSVLPPSILAIVFGLTPAADAISRILKVWLSRKIFNFCMELL